MLDRSCEKVDKTRLSMYLPTIFNFLLKRLESNRTMKYVRFLTIFLSTFIVTYGVPMFERFFNEQEPG